MKTLRLFSMTALVLLMAACNEIHQLEEQGPMHFKATIAAPNSSPATRTTATADGDNYNVAWAVNDEIALVYENKDGKPVCDKATVTAVDGSGNATISAVLNYSVNDNTPVTLVYPYAIVASVNSKYYGKTYSPDTGRFENQKGTIADGFTDGLDWREGNGYFSVTGSGVTLSSSVSMYSEVAIWKLNLTTDGSTPINANEVQISGNLLLYGMYNAYKVLCEAPLLNGVSSLYLFVPICLLNQMYIEDPAATLIIDGTGSGANVFYYNSYNTQLSLTASKIYESTVTLNPLLRLNITDSYIFYCSGETWAQAIAKHLNRNAIWQIQDGKVRNNNKMKYLKNAVGSAYISSTSVINPSAEYTLGD